MSESDESKPGAGEGAPVDEEVSAPDAGAEASKERAAKPKKGKGKGKSVEALKAPAEGEGDEASGRRSYLLGHAVIWLGVLGSVAYLMARGR